MVSRVIAIDGPAASGKSSVASRVADYFGIPYISTGSMYRAIAYVASGEGVDCGNASAELLKPVLNKLKMSYVATANGMQLCVNGKFPTSELRSEKVAALTSIIAAIPEVRIWLSVKQRELAGAGWIVMEGRDIGSEIFPDAAMKFYLTASPWVRAKRRMAQKGETVSGATLEEVAEAISARDRQDSQRKVSPLKIADGATVIDSSDFELDETVGVFIKLISRHRCEYRVPYADTDQMGVVYYANYLEYFERGRTEMLRSVGFSYRDMEKMGVFMPVAEATCHYYAPARYDDLLTIHSWIISARGARMVIGSEIYCGDKLLVKGSVTLGCIDGSRKLVRLPENLIKACSIYLEREEK